jgi:hypothetical protein
MLNIEVPQLVRADAAERTGDRQMMNVQIYKAPLDGTPDTFKKFDHFVATRVNEILTHHFPGYPWKSQCDAQQGIVAFSIPVLMGPTLHQVIRLAEWGDLTPMKVIDAGGELLERFNLPRKGFDAASFIRARDNKHLAQVDFKRRQ